MIDSTRVGMIDSTGGGHYTKKTYVHRGGRRNTVRDT